MTITLKTLNDVENFGYKLASHLKGDETILLEGPLGAGKTTLTKAIGKYLKIKEDIISPTFNIIKVYDSCLGPFYHIDAYRLENLGYDPVLDDYIFDDKAIKVIEWFNFLDDNLFSEKSIKIKIERLEDETRVFMVEGNICLD